MTRMIARAVFNNSAALRTYLSGDLPTPESILRDVFVDAWHQEYRHPDHYLKNRRDYVLGLPRGEAAETTVAHLILRVLEDISRRHLHWIGNRIFVKEKHFEGWQALLPSISPLLVMAYKVYREAGSVPESPRECREYAERWLVPNFRYSSLPYPANPLIEGLIRREGLVEVHCHLNGSTEADYICLDAIAQPHEFYHSLNAAWNCGTWERDAVREQFQQIEAGLRPYDFYLRLNIARELRKAICDRLFQMSDEQFNILHIMGSGLRNRPQWSSHVHPAELALWRADEYGELVLEAGYLIRLFDRLGEDESADLAHALYFSQLTCSQVISLTVQQVEQFGFEQFQKITVNDARNASERDYLRRFHQMSGPGIGDLRFLEGRFAPKASVTKNRLLLHRIHEGFRKFQMQTDSQNRTELGLVCHFIKKPDDGQGGYRHQQLRSSLAEMGRTLVSTCDRQRDTSFLSRILRFSEDPSSHGLDGFSPHKMLVGIDAASNELHTPPEVFAPLFRFLRRHGARNFTYHVGEDFVHLLSGIRAVHEAVEFLGLRSGNRIGHGTAVGIEPKLWRGMIGNTLVMAEGEHLDNLVFAYCRLMDASRSAASLPKLWDQIEMSSRHIYGRSFTPRALHRAWALRSVDPLLAFDAAKRRHILDSREREEELHLLERLNEEEEIWYLYSYYHGQQTSLPKLLGRWNTLIEVDVDLIPCEELRWLQEEQLEEIIDRNIAIESLPTSNVRIGFYNDFAEHHIFRWLGVSQPNSNQPIVCLGSDDPGIFATSIRAEYFHVYSVLVGHFGYSPENAQNVLDRLLRNADVFRFSTEANLTAS